MLDFASTARMTKKEECVLRTTFSKKYSHHQRSRHKKIYKFYFHAYKVKSKQNSTLFFRDIFISATAIKKNEEINTKVSVVIATRRWDGEGS